MGGFYGTVQVRTGDRDAVRAAAESVATVLDCRCYLGPALGGWVGIYPSMHGQDTRFGQAVSERLASPVLHLMVHDDDILAYELWQAGESLDRYWSRPGYFGEEEQAEQEAAAGQPEVLAQMFGGDESELREALRRDQSVAFEYERLTRLAELLGIENGVTAYEYLQWGEREGIRGWKQFEELPAAALADEKSAKQERRKQITAERKRLAKAGLLLAEKKYKGFSVTGLPCVDEQFVVLWNHYADLGGVEVWKSPWKKADRAALHFAEVPSRIVVSADGGRLACTLRELNVIMDCATWKRTHEIDDGQMVLALSNDGSLLAEGIRRISADRAQIEVSVVRLATGVGFARSGELPDAVHAAFSPDEKFLAIAGSDVWLLPLAGNSQAMRRFVGGTLPTNQIVALMSQVEAFDFQQVEQQFAAKMNETVEHTCKWMQRGCPDMSEQDIDALKVRIREQMQQQLESMRTQIEAFRSGQLPAAAQRSTEQPVRIGFARGGELLWCATDKGLRVYDWQAVLGSEAHLPDPVMKFDPVGQDEHGLPQSMIYAAAETADGALVFGGLSGVVCRLDLSTGETSELLTPPEGGAVMHLALTTSGRYLGMTTRPGFPGSRVSPDKQSQVWQVWDYEALVRRM